MRRHAQPSLDHPPFLQPRPLTSGSGARAPLPPPTTQRVSRPRAVGERTIASAPSDVGVRAGTPAPHPLRNRAAVRTGMHTHCALLTQALFLATSAAIDVTCVDEYDSEQLTMAVDAALMELHGSSWFHQLRTTTGYMNALNVGTCTPDSTMWQYPAEDQACGLLKRVLDSGELKVAGVKWSGASADYLTDELNPTGFWPQMMMDIAAKMSAHYGKTISVKRVYYPNSVLVNVEVAKGEEVDMSEPYYYLGGFHQGDPRIEVLSFSCVTSGIASKFFTKAGSSITSTDLLYEALVAGPNRAVGFIGEGNYNSVSHLLPDSTTPSFVTSSDDIEANVLSGALVAGYLSEGEANATLFQTFDTGIISPRVALFRKPKKTCTATDAPSPPPAPLAPAVTLVQEADEAVVTVLVIIVAVVAVVALLLAIVVVHLIRMARRRPARIPPSSLTPRTLPDAARHPAARVPPHVHHPAAQRSNFAVWAPLAGEEGQPALPAARLLQDRRDRRDGLEAGPSLSEDTWSALPRPAAPGPPRPAAPPSAQCAASCAAQLAGAYFPSAGRLRTTTVRT